PATTWADVSRYPSGVNATADPAPPPQPFDDRTRRLATEGMSRSAAPLTAREYASRMSSSDSASASSGSDRSGSATIVRLRLARGAGAAADGHGPLVGAADD